MLLLVIAIVCGTAIFAGLFVCAASLQFFLVNGAELTNSFTYGGSYASVPARVRLPDAAEARLRLPRARRRSPPTCPTLAILDLPGPPLLPAWLVWCTPLAAAWVWVAALALWRWGTGTTKGGGDR